MSLPALTRTPFKQRERLYCSNCGDVIAAKRTDGTYFRKMTSKQHCIVCDDIFRWAVSAAHTKIRTLIKRGQMESWEGKPCADCGAPAICFDLRNYSKPTEVIPVCKSCNTTRGPGTLGERYATGTSKRRLGSQQAYPAEVRSLQR